MFEKYPGIKTYYLLIGLGLLMGFLTYHFAIRHTIASWKLNESLKTSLAKSTDVSYDPAYLNRKKVNLDRILAGYKADTANLRSLAISTLAITAAKNNVRLTEVPGPETTVRAGKFVAQPLRFEGDYFSLIRFLDQVQQSSNIGVVRSVSIKSQPPGQQKQAKRTLTMQIYLTSIASGKATL